MTVYVKTIGPTKITLIANEAQRVPKDGNVPEPLDGFFINNYSSVAVWVSWDSDADAVSGRGERVDAGDIRNIPFYVGKYVSLSAASAADSVIVIGYNEFRAPPEERRAKPFDPHGFEHLRDEARLFAKAVVRELREARGT